MAVTLRLSRGGTTKRPFYKIVAADSRRARDGRFLEKLGTYDPKGDKPKIVLNKERYEHWVKVGAEVSPAVKNAVKLLAATATA
jgi:small subunit ribosomal protein S16